METAQIRSLKDHVGQTVTLAGWLYNSRVSSKVVFLVVRDGSGLCQCVVAKGEVPDDVFERAAHLTQESSVCVTGSVRADERAPGGHELQVSGLEVVFETKDYPITPKAHGIDFSREKAIADNNISQRFVGSFIWELPRWRGNRAARWMLDGWEVNGIISLESGLRFNIVSGRDNSGTGINLDRPDLIGNPYLPADRPRSELINGYFNPAAFRQNAAGTYGNAGRNLIAGPGEALVDLGVVKTFFLTERHRVRFRAEAFNAFNRVNLDNPVGNLLAPNVAKITTAGPPRVFQLALRYEF